MFFLHKKSYIQGNIAMLAVLVFGLVSVLATYVYTQQRNAALDHDGLVEDIQTPTEIAEDFFQGGNDGAEAKELYEKTLQGTLSYNDEAQAKFRLASIDARSPDIDIQYKAIDAFKAIAANVNYSLLWRGNAVEYVGRIYYSQHDQRLFDYIFTGDPYQSYLVEDDIDLSFRQLYEYASSLYPVADAELRIASWYASEVTSLATDSISSTQQALIDGMTTIVQTKLASADRDIQRIMRSGGNTDPRIPRLLNRRANVLGLMFEAGVTDIGDPEVAYREALESVVKTGGTSQLGFTKYHYAAFLARVYSAERSKDISILLRDFYETDIYNDRSVFEFFTNEKDVVPVTAAGKDLQSLASIDTDFKDLLVSLGWNL